VRRRPLPHAPLSFTIFTPVKSRTKPAPRERNPHLQSDALGRNPRGIHILHGLYIEGDPTPGGFSTGGWQPPGQSGHLWWSCSHQPQPGLLAEPLAWLLGQGQESWFHKAQDAPSLQAQPCRHQAVTQILWDAVSCIIKRLEQALDPGSHLWVTGGLLSPDGQLLSKILLHRKATLSPSAWRV